MPWDDRQVMEVLSTLSTVLTVNSGLRTIRQTRLRQKRQPSRFLCLPSRHLSESGNEVPGPAARVFTLVSSSRHERGAHLNPEGGAATDRERHVTAELLIQIEEGDQCTSCGVSCSCLQFQMFRSIEQGRKRPCSTCRNQTGRLTPARTECPSHRATMRVLNRPSGRLLPSMRPQPRHITIWR